MSKGVVEGQTLRAQQWGATAAISSDGIVLTWNNGNRWVKQPAAVSPKGGDPGSRPSPQQKRVKDQAEYDMFNQAMKDAGNPQQALRGLDAWTRNYPDSDFGEDRKVMYVQAYAGTNQPEKAVDLAAQLMKRNLADIFSDPKSGPQLIADVLYATVTAAGKISHPTSEEQVAGETAARMLLAASTKPEGISDTEWSSMRATPQARLAPPPPPPPRSTPTVASGSTGSGPQARNIYRAGGDVTPPHLLIKVEPEYSEAGAQGEATRLGWIELRCDRRGTSYRDQGRARLRTWSR